MRRGKILNIALVIYLLLLSSFISADTIELKDGSKIKGEITVKTDTYIIVKIRDGEFKKIAKDSIKGLDRKSVV